MASNAARAGLIAALAAVALLVLGGPAEGHEARSVEYHVRELPSRGGLLSAGIGINDRGWVSGTSDLAGDTITHAALWRHGQLTDLGTLGGQNSAVAFPSHNDRFVVGVVETGEVNPDGEDWSCNAFFVGPPTHHDCVGFVWQDGQLSALPTLGGHDGFAAGSNRVGQIVGWAENGRRDASCTGTQVRQFRAVLWAPGTHRPRELAPLAGDSTSAAVAINDRGQVVGISGACGTAVGGVSATHALLWDTLGRPHDLGNIGGTQWNTPDAINDRGVVTGFANVPGGSTLASLFPHAFVWTARTGMVDLGTLPGDAISEGLGINDRNQIVGESCQVHFVNCRAFIWQDGRMSNLNDLVTGYPGTLVNAGDINDRGQITGAASDSGATVAYVAAPSGARRAPGSS
jgi:probable HAF family extracellular repeat protein